MVSGIYTCLSCVNKQLGHPEAKTPSFPNNNNKQLIHMSLETALSAMHNFAKISLLHLYAVQDMYKNQNTFHKFWWVTSITLHITYPSLCSLSIICAPPVMLACPIKSCTSLCWCMRQDSLGVNAALEHDVQCYSF